MPAVAAHIYRTNQLKNPSERINLKGIAIGNGLTDPGICIAHAQQQCQCSMAVPPMFLLSDDMDVSPEMRSERA